MLVKVAAMESENNIKMENANKHAVLHFNTSTLYANKVFMGIIHQIVEKVEKNCYVLLGYILF